MSEIILSNRVLNMAESATLAMTNKSRELKAQGIDVISLSIGEPDFNTPESAKQAGIDAITNNDTHYPPVPGRITIVNDEKLANEGAYGVEAGYFNPNDSTEWIKGKKIRYEFGARLAAKMKYTLMQNVDFESKLELFSNYLDHPERIDVDWQNLFVMKVNSWLNCSLGTHLIYDYDIKFPVYDDAGNAMLGPDGNALKTTGSKVQFKEVLAVGVLFNL